MLKTTKQKGKENIRKSRKRGAREQGITLVALVITIIIIIILSTVTIDMAFGENGLIRMAQKAKDVTANSIEAEQEEMNSVMSEYLNVMAEDSELPEPNPPEPEIPGGEEATESGAITFANPIWAGGKASVTISTNTSYTLQYQIVANEGASIDTNWEAVSQGGVVSNLNHRDVVYARLVQDSYYGEEASTTVKDTTPPIISNISTSNITTSSISVTVTASDNETGIASYTYTINGGSQTSNTTGSHTFTGLNAETQYTIQVTVTDKTGHATTETVTETTPRKPATNINEFVAGDYVTYPAPSGNIACRVLYDSTSGYGVQLITSDTVTDSYTLGSSDFTTTKNAYNSAISTLNSAVSSYNNSTYSTVRCVGSVPNNPSQDSAGYFTSSYSYMSSYNGQFKNTDTNYKTDYDQMGTLEIRNIGKSYWLASRSVRSSSSYSSFGVRYVDSSVSPSNHYLCYVFSHGGANAYSGSKGLRPCFTLKSGIKITGGDGTSGSPYTLGV